MKNLNGCIKKKPLGELNRYNVINNTYIFSEIHQMLCKRRVMSKIRIIKKNINN